MRKCLLILLLVALTLPMMSGIALAQEEEPKEESKEESKTVEELYLEGRARYKARDFTGAIESFKGAYKLERNPNFAYNIAKIYEKLKDWDNAIKFYNEFLVLPDIKEKDRKFALEKTKELERIKQIEEEKANQHPMPDKPPNVSYNTGYIIMGTGGALLITGAVFGVLANGKQSAFEDATTSEEKIAAKDSGKTYALVADIGMGLGLVTAGVGLVVHLIGGDAAERDASKVASSKKTQSQVVPWVSTQGGGMSWTLRF